MLSATDGRFARECFVALREMEITGRSIGGRTDPRCNDVIEKIGSGE